MADHIPTVRQRRLAQALREVRHEAGLTQDAVAARMGWHTSKLFRMENARSPRVDWLDVKELMDRDVFTGSYVALEDESSAMRLYCPGLVPGLLPTEDYARAVIRAVAVLRRLVGREQVMAAQLRAGRRRTAPVSHAPGAAVPRGRARQPGGGFVLIEFPEKTDPDVVYVEGIMGEVYLESVEEVRRYQSAFERNQAVALAPEESSAFLSAWARELS